MRGREAHEWRLGIGAVSVVCAAAWSAGSAAGEGCAWWQVRKLVASDAAAGDEYGYPVAIWGEFIVIGAWHDDDHGSNSGSAYVYDRVTGAELFKLTASDASAGAQFGYPITVSDGVALIGAFGDSQLGREAGAAYLFDVTSGVELHKLTASDGRIDDWFGVSVAHSGQYAVVGANQTDDDGPDSGSAYLFDVATGTELMKLRASDAAAGDWFGFDVAIDGDVVLVGARRHNAGAVHAGAVYVFDAGTGEERLKLTASDAEAGANFGRAVAVSGNLAVVGAPLTSHAGLNSGTAYVFDVTTGAEVLRLVADDAAGSANFGVSVAIHGTRAVVGAFGDSERGVAAGAAYVFDVTTGAQVAKLMADDATFFHLLGIRVAIEDETVLAGAWFDRHAGTNSGSAYVFELECGQSCAADLTGDGVLDFFDVQAYLNLYASGADAADVTGDGVLDFFDVQAFLNLFAAGCG